MKTDKYKVDVIFKIEFGSNPKFNLENLETLNRACLEIKTSVNEIKRNNEINDEQRFMFNLLFLFLDELLSKTTSHK
jgi:hypothetical protein